MAAVNLQTENVWTLCAIGVIVACLSSIAHEAVGHAGACLAVGGEVTLLTATHFACLHGGLQVDIAGPLMNLLTAGLAFALLRTRGASTASVRLFLALLGGINLCWFAGEMVTAPGIPSYDEAAIARQLAWPPAIWRPSAFLLGLAIYMGAVRYEAAVFLRQVQLGDPPAGLRRRFGIAPLGGTASFVVAGLCWARDPLAAAWECFLTVGVAAAPLWISLGPAARSPAHSPVGKISFSASWILFATTLFILFLLTQGRGIGRLA